MHGNQMATKAVPALSASDKVFSEMEVLYETLERLESRLISKFDNTYVHPPDVPEINKAVEVLAPGSQTFNGLFTRAQACIYRINRMIDYVNNCES